MEAPSLSSGCFGKLPVAADFISHHARDEESLEFERWLQEGVATARVRFPADAARLLEALPEIRFAYWHGRPERLLCGSLFRGEDKSGRKFPFAVFLQEQADHRLGRASTLPLLLEPVFAESRRIAAASWPDVTSLLRRVDALAELAPAEETLRAPFSPELFAGATLSALDGHPTGGSALRAADLLRALMALRGRAEGPPSPPAFALRLPLPVDPQAARTAACFWLEGARRLFGPAVERPVAFWGSAENSDQNQLDLHFRPPGPLAFLHLLKRDFSSDTLVPLAEEAAEARAASTRGAGFDQRLEEPATPLAEALDLIARDRSSAG